MRRTLPTVFVIYAVFAALMLAAGGVRAAEAGHIVFAAGDATVAGKPITNGQPVQEGDEIATAARGYVYLKTVDNGFLILRPNSRARIVSYHIEAGNPANTRIKLELLGGVARHISGDAVKQAKENFRFNTPVAAIGVRGTDFTVFTDQTTSRVAVISGGVVVSGFSGSCGPEGGGPCEGIASRELFAAQSGQILQVRKGQNVPQLLPINGLSPDLIAPPRADEPAAKSAAGSAAGNASASAPATASTSSPATGAVSLDAQKGANLQSTVLATPATVTPPVVTPPVAPPVITPVPPVLPVLPVVVVEPLKQIVWGRWQAVLDKPATLDLVKELNAKGQLIAINGIFALLRTPGKEWEVPTTGSMGFALRQSEAYVLDESTRIITPAQLANAKLHVDFGNATFATSFDLLNNNQKFQMQSQGKVSRDGQLEGNYQFVSPTNMTVNGLVSPENGGTAAYLFQGRLDSARLATGATAWGK